MIYQYFKFKAEHGRFYCKELVLGRSFLPGTSRFLPAGNVGVEIKGGQWSIPCNGNFLVYDCCYTLITSKYCQNVFDVLSKGPYPLDES